MTKLYPSSVCFADDGAGDPAANAGGGAAQPSIEELQARLDKAEKDKGDAFRLLRDRTLKAQQLEKNVTDLRSEFDEFKRGRSAAPVEGAPRREFDGTEAEPDINAEPTDWMRWNAAKTRRELFARDQQGEQMRSLDSLNSFAVAAEVAARQEHPDYDDAIKYLRNDYRKELEETGELHQAALDAVADPRQRQNIENYAMMHSMTMEDAAAELVVNSAWEYRRQQIVKDARRTSDNPASRAFRLAQRRGYKPKGAEGEITASSSTQIDRSLQEMERKKNLREAGQSLADTAGSEPRDQKVWTRDELENLRRNNPDEYRRAIASIANTMDTDKSKSPDWIKRNLGM